MVFAIIKLYGNILPLSGFLPQIVMRQFWKVSICFFLNNLFFQLTWCQQNFLTTRATGRWDLLFWKEDTWVILQKLYEEIPRYMLFERYNQMRHYCHVCCIPHFTQFMCKTILCHINKADIFTKASQFHMCKGNCFYIWQRWHRGKTVSFIIELFGFIYIRWQLLFFSKTLHSTRILNDSSFENLKFFANKSLISYKAVSFFWQGP